MASYNNLESHETLNWILENADAGFFIITAPSVMQNELAIYYKTSVTAIYDYALNNASYNYSDLDNFANSNQYAKFLFILNMQIPLVDDNGMLLFNMSRDLLEKKKKVWFFFMTKETEYRLSTFAFDIYSHVLIKVHFSLALANNINIWQHPILDRVVNIKKTRESLERYKKIEVKLLSLPFDETPDNQLLSAAIILSDISKLHSVCDEFDEAHKILEFIKAIRVKILGVEHSDTIKTYNEIARIYTLQGEYEKALELYKNILMLYINIEKKEDSNAEQFNHAECNNLDLANVLKAMGDLESRLGHIEAAQKHYADAEQFYRTERNNLGLANVFLSMGDLESRIGEIEAAQKHYDDAEQLYRAERDNLGLANVLKAIGGLDKRLGNLDEAINHYITALDLYIKIQEPMGRIICSAELCRLYAIKKDEQKTLRYAKETNSFLNNVKKDTAEYATSCIREAMEILGLKYEI